MNGEEADALHRATTGNALQLGIRLEAREDVVPLHARSPHAAEALPPAQGLPPCPQRGGWQRTSEKPRICHLDAPHASRISSQSRKSIEADDLEGRVGRG
ncbi:hypothetical protein B0H13DRAFT_2393377 [Mycena leptocephala]|nr:hypothetical protein B0H13DRAFT_2393377 [Mycena leptocephala]